MSAMVDRVVVSSVISATVEEEDKIVVLKEKVSTLAVPFVEADEIIKDYHITETAWYRYLRGHKGIVDNAALGIIATLKWRKLVDADGITESDYESEAVKRLFFMHRTDLENRPIVYVVVRRHNKDDRDIKKIEKSIIHTLDKALLLTVPTEEKLVVCFDLAKFTFKNMDYEAVKILVCILDKNYQEVLKHGLIINAPYIFSACWAIIKPWLDPVTAAKIKFISYDELRKYIAVEDISSDLMTSK